MMVRQSLLLAVATAALAGTGHAQTRGQSRDDLLDALTRHIQICGEITDTQQRLSCYDRLQTQVGGVTAPAPTPTPLQAAPAPSMQSQSPPPTMGSSGSSISSAPLSPQSPSSQPLAPQPLGVPGGGVATLGSPSPSMGAPPPLVTLGATNLTYGDSRYWQVTVTLTSNTPKGVNTQAECTFMNAGRPV